MPISGRVRASGPPAGVVLAGVAVGVGVLVGAAVLVGAEPGQVSLSFTRPARQPRTGVTPGDRLELRRFLQLGNG